MAQAPEKRGPLPGAGVQFASAGLYAPAQRRKAALLVPFFVVINVVMFFITMYINNCPHNTDDDGCIPKFLRRLSFQPLRENPLLGPSTRTLQKLGALDVSKMVHDHQGWRLITCVWLHAGVIHIVVNMLSLLFIGIKLEQEFGPLRIGTVYLISGLGGSLLSALFLRNSISVGASGALFGLLGAMLSELLINWSIYSNKFAALMTLLFVVAINLAIGILPHVDNFAHIGGFISGFLAGFVLLLKAPAGDFPYESQGGSPVRQKHKPYQYLLCIVALMILIAGFSVALVMVLRGVDGNKKCTWCHYLSCVPTSRWNCNNAGGSEYCRTIQLDSQIQLTCLSNNKSISTSADHSQSTLESLCERLCS